MIQSKLITRSDYGLDEREALSRRMGIDESVPHVLLATCNRTELYWGEGDIPRELAAHLFRVAAGLESSLLGERAIQGQVKKAYAQAVARYKLSAQLNRLFQTAMHAGKRVRTETRISEGAVSHSQATVEMLRFDGIDLADKVVGIVGVNKLTEDIMKFLKARGAVNIYLSNRNFDKAAALAARYGGTALGLDRKRELLARCQVLICATSAPHAIVRPDDFPPGRRDGMLVFDLAFPRDVAPEVAALPGVTLYDLEDIERFARQNLTARRNEAVRAEHIIDEEIDKLEKWQEMKKTFSYHS